jgi:DNA repair exonuclease SbcCD ATPase subunit
MEKSEINESNGEKPSSSCFVRALQVSLRLFVAIILGFSVGLGIYLGGRTAYQIAVGPEQAYEQELQDLQNDVAQVGSDLEAQAQIVDEQRSEFEKLVNESADLIAEQSEAVSEQLTVLETELTSVATRLDALEDALADADDPTADVEGQLQLVRAMILLSRAQFWLAEDNLGKASEDVEIARDSVEAQAETWRGEEGYEDDLVILDDVVHRLDLALDDIRTQPTIAADEIEIAWKQLILVTNPENLSVE